MLCRHAAPAQHLAVREIAEAPVVVPMRARERKGARDNRLRLECRAWRAGDRLGRYDARYIILERGIEDHREMAGGRTNVQRAVVFPQFGSLDCDAPMAGAAGPLVAR